MSSISDDQRRSATDFRRVISDLGIEGNILRSSKERSGLILAMGDEAGLGNVMERVVVRDNTLIGNNHTGMVVGSHVRDVTMEGNTFQENGRQGLALADDSTIAGIDIRGNTFVQTDGNGVCASNCSSYEVTHISVGAGAHVSIAGNDTAHRPPESLVAKTRLRSREGSPTSGRGENSLFSRRLAGETGR